MKKIPGQLWVFAGALLFFLATLAENFSGPHDSITYLNGIADGYPLVNQHHLLYHYTAYCWLHFWQFFFPQVRDYYLIEAFSSLFGSASLAVVYSFFRNRFQLPVSTALTGVLVIAFTYGFWFYSVNIEVYAPPLFFILTALYLLTKPVLRTRDWWLVILLHILAILFHQINILFALVILWKLWQQRKQVDLKRWMFRYLLSGAVFVGGAYYIVGWIIEKQNTMEKWIAWLKGYAGGSVYWHPLNAQTPVNISYGFAHAMLGGHYVFQLPPVKKLVDSSLSSHSLGDEIFLSRTIGPTLAILLTLLTLVLVAVTLVLIWRFLRNLKTTCKQQANLLYPLLTCFFCYSLFFAFWMPEILEFWILQTVIWWLVLLGLQYPGRKRLAWVPALLAICLFAINYFGSIRALQHKENDWYYVKAKAISDLAGKNDLVILQNSWILEDFLHYFTDLQVEAVPQKDSSFSRINTAFEHTLAAKQRVFLVPEINNHLSAPPTTYMDSLRLVYQNRIRKLRAAEPEIWVIE